MSTLLAADLRALRRRRVWFAGASLWLAVSVSVALLVGDATVAAGAPDLFAAVFALVIPASPAFHWVRRFLELFSAPCPRCREAFFQTRIRGHALPSLANACGHCALPLFGEPVRPAAGSPPPRR